MQEYTVTSDMGKDKPHDSIKENVIANNIVLWDKAVSHNENC